MVFPVSEALAFDLVLGSGGGPQKEKDRGELFKLHLPLPLYNPETVAIKQSQ